MVSARRYQRFLEEELGQVLQFQAQGLTGISQLPERQLYRQPSSSKEQNHGPLFPVKPVHSSTHGADGHSMHAKGRTVQPDGLPRPYKGNSDRPSHASNGFSNSQSEHQQLKQQSGRKHRALTSALLANPAWSAQANSTELTCASGSSANLQKASQPTAGPAYSQRSINQQPNQHDEQSLLKTVSSNCEQGWQSSRSGADSQSASLGMTPQAGIQQDARQHSSDPGRDGVEPSQQRRRHVLSHMRGISPQRRQLLLQSRVALFDSDSSSSDEEDCSMQKVSSACWNQGFS